MTYSTLFRTSSGITADRFGIEVGLSNAAFRSSGHDKDLGLAQASRPREDR